MAEEFLGALLQLGVSEEVAQIVTEGLRRVDEHRGAIENQARMTGELSRSLQDLGSDLATLKVQVDLLGKGIRNTDHLVAVTSLRMEGCEEKCKTCESKCKTRCDSIDARVTQEID